MQFQGENRAIPLYSPLLQDCYILEQWTPDERYCWTLCVGCVLEPPGVCDGTLLSVLVLRLWRWTPKNCVRGHTLSTWWDTGIFSGADDCRVSPLLPTLLLRRWLWVVGGLLFSILWLGLLGPEWASLCWILDGVASSSVAVLSDRP